MIMKRKHKQKPSNIRKTALERIDILFEQAEEQFSKEPKLSDRYVELARKIAMKYKIKMPSRLKRQYCKHCYTYLMPGANSIIRLTGKTISYYCKKCKKYSRIGYTKKKIKTKTI